MTLKEYANEVYKVILKSATTKEKEYRSLCGKIDILCSYPIGDKELDRIMQIDVERFLDAVLKQRGISKATQNRYRSLLSVIMSNAIGDGYIEVNPVFKIKKNKETPRSLYLEFSEIHKLLEVCKKARNKELYYIVYLAIFTGMRRGEILNLDYKYLQDDSIVLPARITKSGQARDVFLNHDVRAVLEKHMQGRARVGKIFKSKCVQTAFRNARTKAGISDKVRFHDLRRTYATLQKDGGVDLFTISKLLGHTTVMMTQSYLSQDRVKLKNSTKVISAGYNAYKENADKQAGGNDE